MRSLIFYSFILILSACTQQKESATVPTTDSTEKTQPIPAAPVQIVEDSLIFISDIAPFDETKEFYAPVYRLESVKELNFEDMLSKLDSLIYDDEGGYRRRRLPLNIAQQYFKLSGLSRISVYNKTGDLMTDATLVRVEYFEDVIEGGFVAVFKPMNRAMFTTDVAYCTTAPSDRLKKI
ncbi:MAG TPA: hypothetical protein VGK39_04100, partial [Cyclobacteriaceae bacterium]